MSAPEHYSPGPARSRAAVGVALAAGVALLALAKRYGPHRDELYFIQAGRHPDWGYPDQPPLTPLIAAAVDRLAPGSLLALRALSAVCVVAVVLLAADLARALGATRAGQLLAAVVTATAPAVLAIGHLLSTSTVDLLVWVALIRLVVHVVLTGRERLWPVVGVLLGVGLQNKHLVALLALGLLVGMALSRSTRLRSPWLWLGAAIALVCWAPNLLWQASHGWPQAALGADIRADSGGPAGAARALGFQLLLLGPVGGVLVVIGLLAALRRRLPTAPAAAAARVLAVAYLFVLVAVLVTGGKDYYTLGLLVTLAAVGAATVSRRETPWGARALGLAALTSLVALPSALPVLPQSTYASSPWAAVNDDQLNTIGWPEVVRGVRQGLDALSPQQRSRALVVTQNYGEAGAWSWYDGTRPSYSGHNGYALWGPPPDDTAPVVLVTSRPPTSDLWAGCRQVTTLNTGADTEEDGVGVWVCARPAQPWGVVWSRVTRLSA